MHLCKKSICSTLPKKNHRQNISLICFALQEKCGVAAEATKAGGPNTPRRMQATMRVCCDCVSTNYACAGGLRVFQGLVSTRGALSVSRGKKKALLRVCPAFGEGSW